MLLVSGLHLFWKPYPPELTASSPFHIYSFVRTDQSLFPSLQRFILLCLHTFLRNWFFIVQMLDCGYLECLQSLQTAFCREVWSGLARLTTCAHLPSPDLVSRFHLLLCYFTHTPCFSVTFPRAVYVRALFCCSSHVESIFPSAVTILCFYT